MELIGKTIAIILLAIQLVAGFLTVFGILWFIHPYLSIGVGIILAYIWYDEKKSSNFLS
jgi:hypothetical protein